MTATIRRAYLRGDTFTFKSILKDHGWKWDPEQKVWHKDAEWTDEADVVKAVRSYAHIRNRGTFTASVHEI